jgi:hypothetical protein
MRRIILPWAIWAVAILATIIALLAAGEARAEAAFEAQAENGARVTFYKEPCRLKEVSNLPYRAVWTEGEKSYEGCFGARPDHQLLVAYFTDKTVGLIPLSALRKLTGV